MRDPKTTRIRNRRRYILIALALAGLAIAIAAYVFLDANRYKPRIEAYLVERTGLTIELGNIEWGLFPSLHASVDRATVTTDTWRAEIHAITANGDLTELARRRVNISEIRADVATLELPDAPRDWLDVYRDIADGLRPQERKQRRFEAQSIGPIVVDRVEVNSNDFPGTILAARVAVSDVMASEINIDIDGTSPSGGPDSRVQAKATLGRVRGEGLTGFTGTGSIAGLNLNGLIPELPPARLAATLETTSTDPKEIGIDIKGGLTDPEHPVLNGDLAAKFWYTPEHVSLNGIRYAAPGASLLADITRHRSGEVAAEVARFTLDGNALDAFLEQARRDSVYLTASDDAHLTAEDVLFGIRDDGEQEFTRGSLDFSGLAVHDRTGHAYETNIRGQGHMRGRNITVETIEGDHSNFSGTLEPNFETATISYAATGVIRVADEILPPRVSERYIPSASLPVRITELHGSYTRGERPGADLEFDATVDPGTVRLTVAEVDSTIAVNGGTLHFDDGVLNIALDLEADEFGAVQASGDYHIDDRGVEGVVECDVPRVLPNFIPGLEPDSIYASILNQFGRTKVALATTIPRSSYDTIAIAIQHETAPPLEGTIEFARAQEGGLRLGDMHAMGVLESAELDERMKGPFITTGPAEVIFTRDAASETFNVNVDGSQASVRFGQRIEKKPQDPLFITVRGKAPRSGWSADRLLITTFGQKVPIDFVEDGLRLDLTPLNLDAMSALAPEGGFLEGQATLAFDTRDDHFLFGFDDASFSLGDDLRLDTLDGEVRVDSGRIGESRLQMRNPAGECTATWTYAEDQWRGIVNGNYLNVDVLQRILDAIGRAGGTEPADPEAASPGGPAEYPLDGTLDIQLDRVDYQQATFTNVTGTGAASAEAIRLPSINANAYGGTISGNVELLAGSPGTLHTAFTFNGVDTKLLDDIYFEGTRDFHGAATGELMFSAPMGSVQDMLAAGNGSGDFTAVNGTFGEAGWATRFLSVLKTVEIFALRAPWRDEGLSYDTLKANFTLVDGKATLHDTDLTTAAYKMHATGTMDFAANETDIEVNVNLLQSINRIAQHIPIIRNIADLTTERIAIRVNVTGPPSDLSFSVAPAAGIFQNVFGGRDREDNN